MPTVTFIEHSGARHDIECELGRSLMQIALDHNVPGVLGDCGGACSCATCHGHVDPRWAASLPPIGESESFMLDAVAERRGNSRLCCQIRLTAELDGIVVQLPAEQG
jgi:2Fe-2S ferredoxin